MWFMVVAIVGGILAGLIVGGRLGNLAEREVRRWPLLGIGVGLQLVLSVADPPGGFGLLVLSYAALATFAVVNLHYVGMPIFLLGLGLNVVPILVNGGMPVRPEAIVAADIVGADELDTIDFGPKRHLETDDDRVVFLADIIPVSPFKQVLSFGDLIMSVGVANILMRLMQPLRLRRRRDPIEAEFRSPADAHVGDLVAAEREASLPHAD